MKNPFLLIALVVLIPVVGLAAEAPIRRDSNDALRSTTAVRPDGSVMTTVVNPEAHTREETFSDASGYLLRSVLYLLDDRNVAISAIHYSIKPGFKPEVIRKPGTKPAEPEKILRYKEVYKLDMSDRVVESTLTSANGAAMGRRVYAYDSKGRAQVQDYDANGLLISSSSAQPEAKPLIRGRRR
jgi:hypothetical protein